MCVPTFVSINSFAGAAFVQHLPPTNDGNLLYVSMCVCAHSSAITISLESVTPHSSGGVASRCEFPVHVRRTRRVWYRSKPSRSPPPQSNDMRFVRTCGRIPTLAVAAPRTRHVHNNDRLAGRRSTHCDNPSHSRRRRRHRHYTVTIIISPKRRARRGRAILRMRTH